jgi:hypothetical protein
VHSKSENNKKVPEKIRDVIVCENCTKYSEIINTGYSGNRSQGDRWVLGTIPDDMLLPFKELVI